MKNNVCTTEAEDKRIGCIDGLRGIASLVVFANHFLIAFYPALIFPTLGDPRFQGYSMARYLVFSPLSICYSGGFAIMVFFVLSGYGLSYRYFTTASRTAVFSAAAGRYFRLSIPIFFATLLAYGCLRFDLFYNQQTALMIHSQWLGRFYRFDADFPRALIFSFYDVYVAFASSENYNAPLWIMQVMLVGSFLIFFLQILLYPVKKRSLVYLVSLLLLCKTFYSAFVLGMMLCDRSIAGHHPGTVLRNKGVLFFLFMLGIYLGSYKPHGYWMYAPLDNRLAEYYLSTARGLVYHIAGAFLITYVLLRSRVLQWLFSRPPLVFFGTISYSFYILHFIVICSLSCFSFNRLYESMVHKSWCVLITLIITLCFTTLASYLFYMTAERVSIRFSRGIYGRLVGAFRAMAGT